MSSKTVTVFVQIREEYRKYFTMTSSDYVVSEGVDPDNQIEMPNGTLRITSGNFTLNIHADAWITWSVEV